MLVSLVGLLVRLFTADWGCLSGDEANCVAIATTGSWADVFQHLKEDGNAPLYYVLLRLTTQVAGSSDFMLRLLNITISVSLVPIVYLLLRGNRILALQAALLVALCPTLVRWGNMVRMYNLLPILSVTSSWCAIQLMHEPQNTRLRIAHPCLAALLIYCHHWGAFVLIGQAALALLGLAKRWWSLRALLPWGVGMALAALAYLAWVPSLLYTLKADQSPWAKTPPPSYLFIETPAQVLIGDLKFDDDWSEIAMIYCTLWVLFLILRPGTSAVRAAFVDGSGPGGFLSRAACLRYLLIAGMLAAFLASNFKAAWRDRYEVAFTPMLLVALCLMLNRFTASRQFLLAVCLPALLWLPVWTPRLVSLAAGSESTVHEIVAKIKQEADPSKDLVVVPFVAAVPAVSRLLPENIEMICFPDLERVRIVKWDGMSKRIRDEWRMPELFKRMEKGLQAGGVIWLVDAALSTEKVAPADYYLVDRFDFRQIQVLRMNQMRNWLQSHADQQSVFLWGPGRDLSVFLSSYKAKAKVDDSPSPAPTEER